MKKQLLYELASKTRHCVNCGREIKPGEPCIAFYYLAASNSVSGSSCIPCLEGQAVKLLSKVVANAMPKL